MRKLKFFLSLLMLFTFSIGNVWGALANSYTIMTSATSLDESAEYVIGNVETYGCPTNTGGTSINTTEASWVHWKAKNVTGGFYLYNGSVYLKVPASNAWGSGTSSDCSVLTTNSEGIVSGNDGSDDRILVKNSSNAYLRWYKSGQTKAFLYKVQAASKTLSSLSISGDLTTKSYEEGQSLDFSGLTVTGTYSDSSTDDVTDDVTWSFTPALAIGTSSYTVTATIGEISANKNITGITVTEHVVTPGTYSITFNNAFFGTTGLTGSLSGGDLKDYSGSQNDITVQYQKGTASNMYLKDSEIRLYNGGALVITAPTGFNITEITGLGVNIQSNVGEVSSSSPYTWTGASNSVTLSHKNSSGNSPLTTISVTYEVASSIATPTISGTTPFYASTEVSLACETDGSTIYYTTDGSDPDNNSEEYTAPFGLNATTTVKAIAYVGSSHGAIESKTFTKATRYTCAEFAALATNAVGALNEVVVTYASEDGKNVWLKDNTGSLLLFSSAGGFTELNAGDALVGLLGTKAVSTTYIHEIIPSVEKANLTITPGTAPVPEEFTDLPTTDDVNKFVVLKDVTFSTETTISSSAKTANGTINSESVVIYNKFALDKTFAADTKYNIVGLVSYYSGNVQVYYLSAAIAESSITATPASLSLTQAAATSTIDLTYVGISDLDLIEDVALYNDAAHTSAFTGSWFVAGWADNTTKAQIEYIADANDGAARSVYMYIYAIDDNLDDVELVIPVTQAEKTSTVTMAVSPVGAGTATVKGAASAVVTTEEEVVLTATANTGYVFDEWTFDDDSHIVANAGDEKNATMTIYVLDDITATANFKLAAGLAWGAATGTVYTVGKAASVPSLTNPNSLTVVYSSSDTDVATIDASTGAITPVAAGTTTIKATFAGNSTYDAEVSYTLTVAAPTALDVTGTLDVDHYEYNDVIGHAGLVATLTYSDATTWDATAVATWTVDGQAEKHLYNKSDDYSFAATYAGFTDSKIIKVYRNDHAVTFSAPANGTLVVKESGTAISSGDEFHKGVVLTVEATPASAEYKLKSIYAGEENITETKEFTIGTSDVEVSATFEDYPAANISWESTDPVVRTINDPDLLDYSTWQTLLNSGNFSVTVTSSNTDVIPSMQPYVSDHTTSIWYPTSVDGCGTTTITATFAGNDNYRETSVSYTVTIEKADAGLSWDGVDGYNRAWAYMQGKAYTLPTLVNPNGLEVTYSCDANIITIDETTGAIELVSEGAVHITATSAATATHKAGSATYTLYVCGVDFIGISGDADKKVYEYGDAFDPTGLIVTATYTNSGGTSDVTELATWTYDKETITYGGSVSVTASYAGKSDQKYVYDVKVATHAVTWTNPEHGSLEVMDNTFNPFASGTKFRRGIEITVVPSAGAGYQLSTLTANGVDITATGNKFTIDTEDVEIEVSFTPTTPTGIDEAEAEMKAEKIMIDQQVFILRGGKLYNVQGQLVK